MERGSRDNLSLVLVDLSDYLTKFNDFSTCITPKLSEFTPNFNQFIKVPQFMKEDIDMSDEVKSINNNYNQPDLRMSCSHQNSKSFTFQSIMALQ